MLLAPNELARRDGPRIEFTSTPLRIRIGPVFAPCAEQLELRLSVQCTIMTRTQSADRQLFAELLLADRIAVTRDDIARYLETPLRNAADSLCDQPIARSLSDDGRQALLDRLTKALDAAAFNAGFVVLPPFQLDLDSPSLQRQQRDAAERARLADRAADQLQQVKHAAEVLQQFESFRASSPHTPAGELIERIAPSDRLAVFESTLAARASGSPPPIIVAVAGTSIVRFPMSQSPPLPTIIPLPETLGPCRSVRCIGVDNQKLLLIGARTGIWLVDLDHPQDVQAYDDPTLQSSLGFNAAVILGDGTLVATHADGGVVTWQRGEGRAPSRIVRSTALIPEAATGPRSLQSLDAARCVMAIGARLIVADQETRTIVPSVSPRPIVSLLPSDGTILIVHDDGTIALLNSQSMTISSIARFSGAVMAAATFPWIGGARILLSRDDGSIDCVGLNDSLVTRFQSTYPGAPRPISSCVSLIVAGTNDRQRLLAWHPANGRTPMLDLHLPSLTKHRLADVALVES